MPLAIFTSSKAQETKASIKRVYLWHLLNDRHRMTIEEGIGLYLSIIGQPNNRGLVDASLSGCCALKNESSSTFLREHVLSRRTKTQRTIPTVRRLKFSELLVVVLL
jgi:hypothetical protein